MSVFGDRLPTRLLEHFTLYVVLQDDMASLSLTFPRKVSSGKRKAGSIAVCS